MFAIPIYVSANRPLVLATIDSAWPPEEPAFRPDPQEIDDDVPLELDDEYWEVLAPDSDYEPYPEHGDFWTEDR